MASTSRQLQQLLPFLGSLLAILGATRSPISAIRVQESFMFNTTECQNFSVEEACVVPAFPDNYYINPVINFKLAFFNRFATHDKYTLGVVWTAYPDVGPRYQRLVWSANRNRPVAKGAWFTFQPSGSLVLYDSDGSEVWSTQTDNSRAVGFDINSTSGELILYGSENQTIWSSFSHPTDTIVEGQELVWPGMQLVSGSSSTNNSEGAYSLVMEPAGLVLYASLPDPQPYFVWNYFAQSEEAMPVSSLLTTCRSPVTLELSGNGQVVLSNSSLSPIQNNDTSPELCNLQSNYSTIETNSYPNLASYTTFMVLQSDGSLVVYVYQQLGGQLAVDYNFFGNNQCDLPESCGGYGVCGSDGLCGCPINSFLPTNSSDTTEGCSYSGGPLINPCSANAIVQISRLSAIGYYSNRFSAPTSINTSMTECENLCVKNCSCTASFHHSESGDCYSVSEPLSSMIARKNTNLTAFVKISTALPPKKSSKLGLWIGVGISCFIVVLTVVVLGSVIFLFRKKARLARKSREDEFLETLPGLPPRYSRKELDGATMRFMKKLGSGGFGTVYEGTLKDGSKIAVKKLERSKNTKDFRAEMATLGSIHHINLVRLRGFCAEGEENMLVYDYMPNGSLDRWLFHTQSESTRLISDLLDWDTRFKIALGTARGLAYLHEGCSERIIHLDVKPQNILLDNDFNPKVADFGLSKLVEREMTEVVTTMRGTPGYMAPEWLLQAAITERTDVYSYGIVLLELVAGRRCLDISKQDPKERYLPAWLLRCLLRGGTLDAVDPGLDIKDSEEQVTNVIHIALQCIQEESLYRPSMGVVVQMLEGFVRVPDLQRDTVSSKYRFLNYLDLDISGDQSLGSINQYEQFKHLRNSSLRKSRSSSLTTPSSMQKPRSELSS